MSVTFGPAVRYEQQDAVVIVTIARPERRNAVDATTAASLTNAVERAEADASVAVLVLTGAEGAFCAGADLHAIASGNYTEVTYAGPGPMGPTRLQLHKPSIAAIEGPALAGGLELALWCDLRVLASNATLGFANRRFGIPLIDLGTVRLPRLIGHSRAMDLLLTGRLIDGVEAERIGLANRVVEPGTALARALDLAHELSRLPPHSLRNDRLSAIEQWDLDMTSALRNEVWRARATIDTGEPLTGAQRFAESKVR